MGPREQSVALALLGGGEQRTVRCHRVERNDDLARASGRIEHARTRDTKTNPRDPDAEARGDSAGRIEPRARGRGIAPSLRELGREELGLQLVAPRALSPQA